MLWGYFVGFPAFTWIIEWFPLSVVSLFFISSCSTAAYADEPVVALGPLPSGNGVFTCRRFALKVRASSSCGGDCYCELQHPLFLLLFSLLRTFPLCLRGGNYGPAIKASSSPLTLSHWVCGSAGSVYSNTHPHPSEL